MLKEVEFLVNIGCEADSIIRELKKHFSDAIIYLKMYMKQLISFDIIKQKKLILL